MSMATVCVFTFGIIRFRDLGSYDNISEQTKIADDEKNFDISWISTSKKYEKNCLLLYLILYAQLAVSSSSLKCLTAKASLEDLN
jgi:hypothetical protein